MQPPVTTANPTANDDTSQPQTLADRLCAAALKTARSVDGSARISSVAKWEHDDSTLLKVRTDSGASFGVADALRRRWPLATVCTIRDDINGQNETQVLVPTGIDQLHRARAMAKESGAALWMALLVRALGMAAAICFVVVVLSNVMPPR
tara:strand:- start:419 stop:868 length:450 start_codon:yes stop_codon:yes gene_type:complete